MKKKTQLSLHHKVRHYAKMTVLPHKKNQYIPHLTRSYGLISVFVLVLVLLGIYNITATGSVLGDKARISAAGLLEKTNEIRTDAKVSPLALNTELAKAAQLKAYDMLANQYWAHTAPDGTEPWAWFNEVGYSYNAAGENLAKNFTTDQAVVAAWMNSKDHRENVINGEYSEVGFAIADGLLDGKQTRLVVALYGAPADQAEVAGSITTGSNFIEAPIGTGSIMTRTGYYMQSISPAVLASFILLLLTAMVAFAAQANRKKMPKAWQRGWRKHHGLYKGVASLAFIVGIVALYSGGQL